MRASTLQRWLLLLSSAAVACQPSPPEISSSWPTETAPVSNAPAERQPVSLVPVIPAAEDAAPEPVGEPATLTAAPDEAIALYDEPAPEFWVAEAAAGDRFQVFKAQRMAGGEVWYYGQLDDGVEGWIAGGSVSFEPLADISGPYVVLPGGAEVLQQPDDDAEVLQSLESGSVVMMEQNPNGDRDWLYSGGGGGWVAGESLFRPSCIKFNGYMPLVVVAGGTTVHDTAAYQIPVKTRLEGGELVFPMDITQNSTGTWLQTAQGWISGQSLFYPFCES